MIDKEVERSSDLMNDVIFAGIGIEFGLPVWIVYF